MKTKHKINIAITMIALSLFTFTLTGCSEITPINANAFSKAAQSANLEYQDIKSSTFDGYALDGAYITRNDDYQIEFYEFNQTKDARDVFAYLKEDTDDEYNGSKTSINLGETEKFTVQDKEEYIVIERAQNTIVYAYTDNATDHKQDIQTFLTGIGY